MTKKLNIGGITDDLKGSAFFPQKRQDPPSLLEREERSSVQANLAIPERANARTPDRSIGKRIITRNAFEIYEDEMDALRKLSFEEKREGKVGSMSAMVREAIDNYLLKRKPQK